MSGRFPRKSPLSSGQPTDVSSALFRRQQLWVKLAAYRPLAVLAGIWVVLLAIALFAYGQLLHTVNDAKEADVSTADLNVYPHERLNEGENSQPSESEEADPPSEEAPTEPENATATPPPAETGFSGWTLVALVGTCAVGCWLVSAQVKSSASRSRYKAKKSAQKPAKKRVLISPNQPSATPSRRSQTTASSSSPKPLPPYDPTQPLMVPQQEREVPPQKTPSSTVSSRANNNTTPPTPVAVVSEDAHHRLDWPEDSLVNTADVRQRRSLSSFL
ncbi:hypothetical protein PN498_23120 [Oscillatoria sp. CS-180]|uniref:hypothetical protein n=1 Tax=Oscillatoria sp. CS-180 TaxID=3021720 RepID=UPI00232B2CB4|nr:hypothetical protein [Oscillatoria sp. CS-180]MDB9528903.1 hypothetical protein [Oscillatoria sp. CS-180]